MVYLWSAAADKADKQQDGVEGPVIDINEPEETVDPGLLKKHSEIRSFTTSRFTYPSLRIFYREHPQAEKLPTIPAPLPLLVFLHGLGGSTYQFHSLLTSLVNLASCLSVDLPGCGLSEFAPKDWNAYTTEALVELLGDIIKDYRLENQGVVLIGHSMGGSLGALLASHTSPYKHVITDHVVGLLAICPKADPPPEDQVATFRKLLWVPNIVFDAWRWYDQRGGKNSASVIRFVGADADDETKKLQQRFNGQSNSAVFRRMASGTLPVYKKGIPEGGLPGRDVWAGLQCPVFLVAGEADHVTKPEELEKITSFLGKSHPLHNEVKDDSQAIADSAAPVSISNGPIALVSETRLSQVVTAQRSEPNPDTTADVNENPSTPNDEPTAIPPYQVKPRKVLKTTILPAPASHALLYMPSTVRILAGLISDFLCSQVSPRCL